MSSLPVTVVLLLVFLSLCYGARVPSQGGILGASDVPNYKIVDSEGPTSVLTKVISSTSPVTHVSSPETNDVKAPVNIANISKSEQRHSGSIDHKEVPNAELHMYHETSHTNPLVKQEEGIYSKDVENFDLHVVSKTNESKAKPGSMMGPTGISNIGLDSTIDEEVVETRSNIPEISNLKIAVSHNEQLSPVIFQIMSSSSTESNDISPEILPLKDNIVTEKAMKIETHDEKILDSFSKISSSIPPKQKSKFATGKHQETVKINSIEDDWRDLEKKFRTYTDTVMKKALPKFLRIHSQLNISSQCNAALMQMAYGLRNLKSWAIKMVDASGHLPSGSLDGTLTDLGDYDQCLDVKQPRRNKHSEIKGQYCTLELKPILPALHQSVTLNTKVLDFGNASKDSVLSDLSHGSALFHFMVMRIGICVPSPCVADDIREMAAALLSICNVKKTSYFEINNGEIQKLMVSDPPNSSFLILSICNVKKTCYFEINNGEIQKLMVTDPPNSLFLILRKVPVQVFVRNCEIEQKIHITIPQFIVLTSATILGLLIIAGTCLDGYVKRNITKSDDIGRVPQSLLAFSLVANVRQLFRTSRKSSALLSVNGIRCLSLMWIVLAHTYGFGHRQGLARLSHAKTYMDDVLFQIITNAWVSVDTFFLLGGLLVAFSNLKVMENNGGSINFASHVLHRLWRLTPPLAGTLGVMFLLPLVGSGPLWSDMVGQKVANCEKRWWQVFLPVNTWIDFGSMCLLHTWYVAADIHFYCLAPLVLILLYRWPAFGFALLFLLTAICSLITGMLTLINDLPPTVIFFSPDVEMTKRTANLIYFRPYPHIGAYCVGLALGYILWRYRKFSLPKIWQGAGWILSSSSCLAVLFATYSWSRGQSARPAEGIMYAILHRTVWAAGVAWVLFICATGHGGLLNKFLSWQVFGPLSKLCYSVYLLHFPVLWVRVSWRRTLLNFHHYDIVTEFFGILMITLGLSILFHLVFEAPFLRLEQIWFPERGRSTKTAKPLDEKATT